MNVLWAIQKMAVNDLDSSDMVEAIQSLGLRHEIVNVVPFDYGAIPDIDFDGTIIPYGGTNFIDKIYKSKPWACWFNDNFKYNLYLKHYGKHMFNSDGICMKMRDFSPSLYPKKEFLFIRPNLDLKEFAGNVVRAEDFAGWYRKVKDQGWMVNENTEIVVAQASKIDEEWRVFIVDSTPVSASMYRKDHFMSKVADAPPKVYAFVEQMVDIWKPADVFVMDICSLNGELYILELGDMHSAGWYLSDKKAIIKAVSDFAESEYEFCRMANPDECQSIHIPSWLKDYAD